MGAASVSRKETKCSTRKKRAGIESKAERERAEEVYADVLKRSSAIGRRAEARRVSRTGEKERESVVNLEAAKFRAHIQRRVAVLRGDALAPAIRRKK